MANLIDKDALVAEIERRKKYYENIQMIKPVYENNIEDFNELLSFIDSLQEEPVSEDLEKASKEWLAPQLDKSCAAYGETKQMELTHFDGYAMLDAIEFGANWQKEQMMKDAVETIIDSKPNDYGEFIPIVHVKVGSSYKYGEKVRIIIIKEETCG